MTTVGLPVPASGPVPVRGGLPTGLSPSRAADFLSCPLLYRFRVIDRLPERPSPAAARGTLVHAVLERLFDLAPADRTLARAQAMVEPEWARLQESSPELVGVFDTGAEPGPEAPADERTDSGAAGWLSGAAALLERYYTLEDPRRLEPAERELYVETVLDDGLQLRGFIDRLDVAPGNGETRLVDYKTGKAPPPGLEARAMFQMRFYALVWWRLHGRVPRLLQLVYLGSGEVLRYAPDEADLLATERKVQALWAAIVRANSSGDWRPSPGRLCTWCDHQALCPAFGGTPPPLPVQASVPASAGPEAGAKVQGRP